MNELALFAGAGGGILGGHLLGWRTVCVVEIDPYAASVLVARQNDGILPPFPIWDDVCTFDGTPWRGIVDVVSGGFPCQDISVAGKGAGIDGARSGLWSHMARIIGEVRPRYAFIENSPALATRGLNRVLADLAAMGFDAEWGIVSAADCGASHLRERIWILANISSGRCGGKDAREMEQQGRTKAICSSVTSDADCTWQLQQEGRERNERRRLSNCDNTDADVSSAGLEGQRQPIGIQSERTTLGSVEWWRTEPDVVRVANGIPARMDRIKSLGNAQVPAVAATAWRLLHDRLMSATTPSNPSSKAPNHGPDQR